MCEKVGYMLQVGIAVNMPEAVTPYYETNDGRELRGAKPICLIPVFATREDAESWAAVAGGRIEPIPLE